MLEASRSGSSFLALAPAPAPAPAPALSIGHESEPFNRCHKRDGEAVSVDNLAAFCGVLFLSVNRPFNREKRAGPNDEGSYIAPSLPGDPRLFFRCRGFVAVEVVAPMRLPVRSIRHLVVRESRTQ